MAKVITLGEILLRLSPPGNQRFLQADSFDVNYGGSEANVAFSLAMFGHDSVFVSKVPNNLIGDCAVQTLKKQGIDCSYIVRGGNRLGVYYLENGASVRPSNVIYDRAGSAFAESDSKEYSLEQIMNGADLFHVSGITAVLSEKAGELTVEAAKIAQNMGLTISLDLNYRKKLWTKDILQKQKIISKLMEYTDICFGNPLDAARCLGYRNEETDFENSDYKFCISGEEMEKVVKRYGLKYLVTTNRTSISASDNGWSAAASDGETLYKGKNYVLHIVDRVGGGDAFTAGFLHGYLCGKSMEESLEYAIASGAIKHTIPGDLNYTTIEEIEALLQNEGSGRVDR